VISLQEIPYIHRVYTYICMVLANFTHRGPGVLLLQVPTPCDTMRVPGILSARKGSNFWHPISYNIIKAALPCRSFASTLIVALELRVYMSQDDKDVLSLVESLQAHLLLCMNCMCMSQDDKDVLSLVESLQAHLLLCMNCVCMSQDDKDVLSSVESSPRILYGAGKAHQSILVWHVKALWSYLKTRTIPFPSRCYYYDRYRS